MPHDDYEDPRKQDPRFPERPTHPDFMVLSTVVQQNDIQAERLGGNPLEMVEVDQKSMLYFLRNRIGIFGQRLGFDISDPRVQTALMSLYIDAFALGRGYEAAGEYRGADRD